MTKHQRIANILFLLGSIGTSVLAPNPLVFAGGIGLTTAALFTFVTSKTQPWQCFSVKMVDVCASIANVFLIINGQNLAASGIVTNSFYTAMAGTLLTAANCYWFYANMRSLFGLSAPLEHANLSCIAGICITLAGLVLMDPWLAIIGIVFTANGILRLKEKTA